MEGVAAHPVAHDFGQNRRAAAFREFQLFQNQNARAFADDEAIAVAIERPAKHARDRHCAAIARAWRRIRRRPGA